MELTKPKLLKQGWPILVFDIPDPIWEEIEEIVEDGKRTKDHPLSYLKENINAGYNHSDTVGNEYQCNVNINLIQKSFLFPWILRLSEKYCTHLGFDSPKPNSLGFYRSTVIYPRHLLSHSEGYDMWINFAKKGSRNRPHTHRPCDIAGVIYCQNKSKDPTIFHMGKNSVEYSGIEKTMILIRADLLHEVKEKMTDDERITIAFNVNFTSGSGVNRISQIQNLSFRF